MNKQLLKCFESGYLFDLMKSFERRLEVLKEENNKDFPYNSEVISVGPIESAIEDIKQELISRDYRIY